MSDDQLDLPARRPLSTLSRDLLLLFSDLLRSVLGPAPGAAAHLVDRPHAKLELLRPDVENSGPKSSAPCRHLPCCPARGPRAGRSQVQAREGPSGRCLGRAAAASGVPGLGDAAAIIFWPLSFRFS